MRRWLMYVMYGGLRLIIRLTRHSDGVSSSYYYYGKSDYMARLIGSSSMLTCPHSSGLSVRAIDTGQYVQDVQDVLTTCM
jgi:hypothetical protein